MNFVFRLLLTFNATSLVLIVFAVHNNYILGSIFAISGLSAWYDFASYLGYLLIPVLLTQLSIFLSCFLGKDHFDRGILIKIENANNSFLPSYLGYFFVALSVDNLQTLWFVYFLIFLFTVVSQALYFNPILLLFGYRFYHAETRNGSKIFLISRKNYKTPKEINRIDVFRINDYTFIEVKNDK